MLDVSHMLPCISCDLASDLLSFLIPNLFYCFEPSQFLKVIIITSTLGKTITRYLIFFLLSAWSTVSDKTLLGAKVQIPYSVVAFYNSINSCKGIFSFSCIECYTLAGWISKTRSFFSQLWPLSQQIHLTSVIEWADLWIGLSISQRHTGSTINNTYVHCIIVREKLWQNVKA